jgi:predicted small secreted protein
MVPFASHLRQAKQPGPSCPVPGRNFGAADPFSIQVKIERITALTKSLAPLLAVLFALGVSACNTVEGAGEDIRATGDAIDEAAEDAAE